MIFHDVNTNATAVLSLKSQCCFFFDIQLRWAYQRDTCGRGLANLQQTKGHSGRDRCCCCWWCCCCVCSQMLQLLRLLCQDDHIPRSPQQHTVLQCAMLIACTIHCFQLIILLFVPPASCCLCLCWGLIYCWFSKYSASQCMSLALLQAVSLNYD